MKLLDTLMVNNSNEKHKKGTVYRLDIQEKYLNYIIQGEKTFEGRINLPEFGEIEKGDYIYFTSSEKKWAVCRIERVDRYSSFLKMLVSEGVLNMIPDIDPKTNTAEEMLSKAEKIYTQFYHYKQGVERFGAIAFEIKYQAGAVKPQNYVPVSITEELL